MLAAAIFDAARAEVTVFAVDGLMLGDLGITIY